MATLQEMVDKGIAQSVGAGKSYPDRDTLDKVIATMGTLIAPDTKGTKQVATVKTLSLDQLKEKGAGFNPTEALAVAITLGFRTNDSAKFVELAYEDFRKRGNYLSQRESAPLIHEGRLVRDLLPGAVATLRVREKDKLESILIDEDEEDLPHRRKVKAPKASAAPAVSAPVVSPPVISAPAAPPKPSAAAPVKPRQEPVHTPRPPVAKPPVAKAPVVPPAPKPATPAPLQSKPVAVTPAPSPAVLPAHPDIIESSSTAVVAEQTDKTQWPYDSQIPAWLAAGQLDSVKEHYRTEGGVGERTQIAIGMIEANWPNIKPMTDAIAAIRRGDMARFDAIAAALHNNKLPDDVTAPEPSKPSSPPPAPVAAEPVVTPEVIIPEVAAPEPVQREVTPVVAAPAALPVVVKIPEAPKPSSPPPAAPAANAITQAHLNTCFVIPHPRLDAEAQGVERAYAVTTFFKMLREARGFDSFSALAQAIADSAPGTDPVTVLNVIREMGVPEPALAAEPTERAKAARYQKTTTPEMAEVIANYAYPGDRLADLRQRCTEFFGSAKYRARKPRKGGFVSGLEEQTETTALPVVHFGFEPAVTGNSDKLDAAKALAAVTKAREAFAAMEKYDHAKADAIAGQLFHDLTEGYTNYRVEELSSGKVNGHDAKIGYGTVRNWRVGRKEGDVVLKQAVQIDTTIQGCDALTQALIADSALATEAAQYMAGLPWDAPKTNAQILDLGLQKNMDGSDVMLLMRRQMRMNQREHGDYVDIGIQQYTNLNLPQNTPAWKIGIRDFETFVERQHLVDSEGVGDLKRKAQFRKLMLRQPQTDFDAARAQLAQAAAAPSAGANAANEARAMLTQIQDMHGIRNASELAEAICNYEEQKNHVMLSQQRKIFKLALKKIADGETQPLSPDMLRWTVNFALPEDAPHAAREGLTGRLEALARGVERTDSHIAVANRPAGDNTGIT